MAASVITKSASGTKSAAIRARLNHPVIDGDGHLCEHMPTFTDYLKDTAGPELVKDFFNAWKNEGWYGLSRAERQRQHMRRPSWWTYPTKNTLDRATAMMPALLRERMDDFGIDFMIAYTSIGLSLVAMARDEFRQAGCRALNRMLTDLCRGQEDRITPAAAIPMYTPEEAIAELDHVVGELGMKAIMIGSNVKRPIEDGMRDTRGQLVNASWVDTLGVDSLYDYDPVWAKCIELKVAPTAHSASAGWDARTSYTNYVYNHVGSFAWAGEAFCKGLLLGGVTYRFPQLNFAFLEGGLPGLVSFTTVWSGTAQSATVRTSRTIIPPWSTKRCSTSWPKSTVAISTTPNRVSGALCPGHTARRSRTSSTNLPAAHIETAEDFTSALRAQLLFRLRS